MSSIWPEEGLSIPKIDPITKSKIVVLEKEGIYPIKWACLSNEQDILFQRTFRRLFNNKNNHDVVLICQSKKYYCHSPVITRAEYLKKNLLGSSGEVCKKELDVTPVISDSVVFEKLLKYLYTGKLNYPEKGEEVKLYKASLKLGLLDAADLYMAVMCTYLTPADACGLLEKMQERKFFHSFEILAKLVGKYIQQILKSPTFLKFSKGNVLGLCQNSNLAVDECDLFEAVRKWCKHYAGENSVEFSEVFKEFEEHIRYPLMLPSFIVASVEPLGIVQRKFLLEAYKFNSLSGEEQEMFARDNIRMKPRGSAGVRFKFCNSGLPNYIALHDGNTRVTTSGNSYSRTVYGDVVFNKKGIYFFEFSVTKTLPNYSYIMIGVADPSNSKTIFMGNNPRGWAIYLYQGNKYNSSRSTPFGKKIVGPTVVGVVLDFSKLNDGKIYFIVNGKAWGMAFSGITPPVSPAVTVYSNVDEVKISKSPKLHPKWKIRQI